MGTRWWEGSIDSSFEWEQRQDGSLYEQRDKTVAWDSSIDGRAACTAAMNVSMVGLVA